MKIGYFGTLYHSFKNKILLQNQNFIYISNSFTIAKHICNFIICQPLQSNIALFLYIKREWEIKDGYIYMVKLLETP